MASVRQLTTPNREGKHPWVVEYTDAGGKRRRATPPSGLKKDAEKLRQKIEREMQDDQHVPKAETTTIRSVCEEFMRLIELRVKDKSISAGRRLHYKTVIYRHLIPALGSRRANSLTLADAEALHTALIKKGINPVTVRHYLGACVSVERFSSKRGFSRTDIFSSYMKDRPLGQVEKIRTFEIQEVRHLLYNASLRPKGYQHRNQAFLACIVNLAAFCGLRRGEILGLTIQNIDLAAGFLRVRHNLDRADMLKGPKTRAGLRDVPLPRHVADLLREWVCKWMVADKRQLIFRTPEGFMYHSGNFNSRWKDLLDRSGLGEPDAEGRTFHFHALRHFAASYMIECGWSLPDVAALLGHAKFDMTLQTYAHAVAGGRQRCDKMQAMAQRLLAEDAIQLLPAVAHATETRQSLITH
jgi:integrase